MAELSELESTSAMVWLEERYKFYKERKEKRGTAEASVFARLRSLVNADATMTSRQRIYVEDWVKMSGGIQNQLEKIFLVATYINSCR